MATTSKPTGRPIEVMRARTADLIAELHARAAFCLIITPDDVSSAFEEQGVTMSPTACAVLAIKVDREEIEQAMREVVTAALIKLRRPK